MMTYRAISFSLLFLLVALPVSAATPPRGYQSRACGFDLNHNGIIGEPADCGLLCSSGPSGSDGDVTISGSTYTQVYVDCVGGNNSNAGTRTSPKKSITSALIVTPTTGASLAVCFSGTCTAVTDEVFPLQPRSGITATWTRAASGNEHRAFEYPSKPAFIIGWDRNAPFADYPPHDTSDTAVIDGTNTQDQMFTNTAGAHHLELAHFTGQNIVQIDAIGSFFNLNANGLGVSHLFFHDLMLLNIFKGKQALAQNIVVTVSQPTQWFAFENSAILDFGSYLFRGSCDPPCSGGGPLRFAHLSSRSYSFGDGVNSLPGDVFKVWGIINGFEVIDNIFDFNPAAWGPTQDGNQATTMVLAQCTQDWWIVNNQFLDWPIFMIIQPFSAAGVCNTRPIDAVVVDRNEWRNTRAWSVDGGNSNGVRMEGGDPGVANVTFTNNLISSTTYRQHCFELSPGSPAGTITVVGNTCSFPQGTFNPAQLQVDSGANHTFVVEDNIFQVSNGVGPMMLWAIAPSRMMNANVYSYGSTGSAKYLWNNGSATNLATWKTNSGDGSASKECAPSFKNSASGDLHLQGPGDPSPDSCAKDAGVPLTGITAVDYDGDTRPQGTLWDIGADEYTPSTGLLGDLDANGVVDILDLQHLVNVLLGLETNPRADLDGDGSATVLDLQRLVNILLGV